MRKITKKDKLYIVRKYIFAKSAPEALKRERRHKPDDIFLDEDYRKMRPVELESAMGFHVIPEYEDE